MMQHGYLPYPAQQAYHPSQQNQLSQQQSAHQSYQHQAQQQQYSNQQLLSLQQQQQQQQQLVSNNLKENGFFKRVTNSDLKIPLNRPTDSVPEAKKARYDMSQQNAATKVVSLRNIPNEVTDLQVALIGLQFGDVVNILYIKGKGQALIDMGNISEAIDMVQYFHSMPDQTNLKNIEAAHSSYQQLTIDNNRAAATLNTIQLAKQIKEASNNGGDGCVVKAIITQIAYPICIDALYQVFSKYGNVLKIVLIQKNELGALIQMKDEIQVQQAVHNLNGRNMYNTYTGGCNILNLQLSRHKSIEVKSNNSKSWDYTNPILPINEQRMGNNGNSDMGGMNNMIGGNAGQMGQNQNQLNKNNMIADHPLLPMPINMAAAAAAAAASAMNPFNNNSPFISQQNQHNQSGTSGSSQNPYSSAAVAAAAAAAVAANATGYSIQMDTRSAVVQVSNFPDQIANPDALFTLFGVYGDILKVKIMYNRRDNALMQFKCYEQAFNAVSKMDKVKLFDKVISVGLSKFPEIQIPIKNDGGLAKDYSTSPLHRFKKPGSKNFFNIFAPNSTLHLSNISQMTSQDQVQELFAKHGTITNFKWISKEGNKMALIELSSLEESVMALIALHNHQLNGSYLRVNFAK